VGADVLVRHQDVARVARGDNLLQEQIGLVNHFAGGEGPVRTDTFAAHALRVDDAGVVMAARGDEAPEPGQGGRQDMEQADDAVRRLLAGAGRGADAETADIDFDRFTDDAWHKAARHDHARVGAGFAWGILNVFPDQAGRFRNRVVVEEDQWLRRMDAEALQVRIGAISLDVVGAQEPAIFCVFDHQLMTVILQGWMAKRHIIGYRTQIARFNQVDVVLFLADQIL